MVGGYGLVLLFDIIFLVRSKPILKIYTIRHILKSSASAYESSGLVKVHYDLFNHFNHLHCPNWSHAKQESVLKSDPNVCLAVHRSSQKWHISFCHVFSNMYVLRAKTDEALSSQRPIFFNPISGKILVLTLWAKMFSASEIADSWKCNILWTKCVIKLLLLFFLQTIKHGI